MSNLNPSCDGSHCTSASAPVKLYPLGGGGNLILCRACFNHENRFRLGRARDTGEPQNWPHVAWDTAKAYPES